MDEKLERLQDLIKIRFKDLSLLEAALTHPSSHEGRDIPAHHRFERMEFFGDAVLSLVVTEQLLKTFPDLDEGHLSKYRSTLVSREALFHIIASQLNLHDFIVVGPGEMLKSPRDKAKILADVSEALFAAIYHDQGLDVVRQFILGYYTAHLSEGEINEIAFNAKGALQEEIQKRTQQLPEYEFEREASGTFLCRVKGGELGSAEGRGPSKKEAAQQAAAELLKKLAAPVSEQQGNLVAPAILNTGAESSATVSPSTSPVSSNRPPSERRPFRNPHRRRHRSRRPPWSQRRQGGDGQGAPQAQAPQDGNTTSSHTPHTPSHTPSSTHSHPHSPSSPSSPSHHRSSQGGPHRGGPRRHDHSGPRRHHSSGGSGGGRRPMNRNPEHNVDWRTWQSIRKSEREAPNQPEESTPAKPTWRDRLKKLTGRIKKDSSE